MEPKASAAARRRSVTALAPLARISAAMARAVASPPPCTADGWHVLTLPVESIDVAVGEFLRLGASVEALEPPALRAALRTAVEALNALYAPVHERSPRGNSRRSRKR